MDVQINWLAVVLATLSSMIVGSIWYAKPVFGEKWAKLVKLDDKKCKPVHHVPLVSRLLSVF